MTWTPDMFRFGGRVKKALVDGIALRMTATDVDKAIKYKVVTFTGALTADANVTIVYGDGADWTFENATTGGKNVIVAGPNGGSVTIPPSARYDVRMIDGNIVMATAGIATVSNLVGDVNGPVGANTLNKMSGATVPPASPSAGGPAANWLLMASATTSLTFGLLTDANVATGASIDGRKVTPNFGAQDLTARDGHFVGVMLRKDPSTSGGGSLWSILGSQAQAGSAKPGGDLLLAGGAGDGSAQPGKVLIQSVASPVRIHWLGDSNTVGNDDDEAGFIGGPRFAFYQYLRQFRSDFDLIGSVITVPELCAPGLWFHDGHSGFKIADLTTNYASYVATSGVGAPDLIIDSIGTNDVDAGRTLVQMQTDRAALDAQYATSAPNAKVLILAVLPFAAGTVTGGNLATWNAARAAYNSWLQNTYVPSKGPNYYFCDPGVGLTTGEYQTTGIHLTREGQARWGKNVATFVQDNILGVPSGAVLPRRFKQRRMQGALKCAASSDGATATAHAGFNPGTGSYILAFDYYPTALASGSHTVVAYGASAGSGSIAIIQNSRDLNIYWNGNAGTIIGGGAGNSTSTYTLTLNTWHRVVVMADAATGTVGLYVNGILVGLVQGVSGWSYAQQTLYLGHGPDSGAAPGFYGRVHAYKPSSIPRPGSMAAQIAVENDYYDEVSIVAGGITASFNLSSSLTDNINGNPAFVLVSGGALAAIPDGTPATTPLRPWEFGFDAPSDALIRPIVDSSGQTFYGTGKTLGTFTTTTASDWVMTLNATASARLALYANGASQFVQVQATDASGKVIVDTPTIYMRDGGAGAVVTWTLLHSGASNALIDPAVTSFAWKYGSTTLSTLTSSLTKFNVAHAGNVVAVTYNAAMTPDASQGNYFRIVVTNGTAFTINNPTNPTDGQVITLEIKNASGGAMGVISWGSAWKRSAGTGLVAANITNGNRGTARFVYDATDSQWVQVGGAVCDVPN